MRNAFASEVFELASRDDRFFLLSGDIGNRLFNSYKENFGDRFLNCGVAEANMTGVAAGMAMAGLRPMTYTITTFNTARCFEQIRIDLCYHNLPVTVVGVGGGLSYAGLGYTHHATEDIGMMRLLPNMTVLCPGDAMEVKAALNTAHDHDGPVYIRLGKKGEDVIHQSAPQMKIGGSNIVREGNDVCLLAVGTMLPMACRTADLLEQSGHSTQVVSFYSVKPMDEKLLADVFNRFKLIVVVEEHSQIGGAGSAVSEWLAEAVDVSAKFLPIGLPDRIFEKSGGQSFAQSQLGLTPESVRDRIETALTGVEN